MAKKKEVRAPGKTAARKSVKKAPAKKKSPAKKAVKKAPVKTSRSKTKVIAIEKSPVELLADAAVDGILEVKGRNISVLDLRSIHNRVCDYFIICQADSTTQVNAIAGSVEKIVKERTGEKPYRSEGFENAEWILVDYVNVVIHIFQTQVREFYNLEGLWADAEVKEIAFD